MKFILKCVVALLGLFALYIFVVLIWPMMYLPQESFRQRLTVEIETPEGLRSGSSVTEVTWTKQPFGNDHTGKATGEAVFVDLGSGRFAVALLASGPKAQDVNWPQYVYEPIVRMPGSTLSAARAARAAVGQKVELALDRLPTIITFTDLADPASVKVIHGTDYRQQCADPTKQLPNCRHEDVPVPIDEIAATFGPGHAFRRATLEIVPNDTPITRGIDKRLPVIIEKLSALNSGSMSDRMYAPFFVRAGHFIAR